MRSSTKFVLVFLVSMLLSASISAADEKPFSVGIVAPLTGALSFQGVSVRNAVTLAAEEWDTKGRLALHFEDDAWLPKNTVAAVQKLRTHDSIRFLIVFGANQGAAAAEIAEREALPMASISVLPSVIANRRYITLFLPSVPSLMTKTIDRVKQQGYKTVAIAASVQDATLLQKKLLEESGATKIVLSEEHLHEDLDFRALSAKIAKLSPDAVFLSLLPPQASTLARQLRTLGYRGAFFGGIQMANRDEIANAEGALRGTWVVAGDDRNAASFYERYEKRFKGKCTAEAIYGYDIIKMLLEALERGVEPNEYFHTVKSFTGGVGTYGADGKGSYTFGVIAKEMTTDGFRVLDQ